MARSLHLQSIDPVRRELGAGGLYKTSPTMLQAVMAALFPLLSMSVLWLLLLRLWHSLRLLEWCLHGGVAGSREYKASTPKWRVS